MFSSKVAFKNRRVLLVLPALITVGIVFLLARSIETPIQPPPDALYLDSTAPTEMRITNLLSYMTIEEKVAQMALVDKNSVKRVRDVSTYGLGALLSGGGAKPETNTVLGWATMVSDFIHASKESRLGIPILYGVDAIHGHSNIPGATIFPHAIGLGATRDPALVEDVANATAEELMATNINWSFSPNLDMPRDMRWGRVYEAFSDDPRLVSTLGTAYLRGIQKKNWSSSTATFSVLATPKHFLGVGAMRWGSSYNKNFTIDQGVTNVDDGALRREYLIPFTAVVDAGAKSIMVGLNGWGDTRIAGSKYLLTTVLKEELGFEGFLVSDWYGVYEIPGSDYDNAVTSINAGIDMVMLPFDYKPFIKNVTRAVRAGEISQARIDDAVRRILRAKFALGLFDGGTIAPAQSVVGSPEHRALARKAVAQSLVLLKNEGVLPIRKNIQHIRVAGSSADNVGRQAGAWTVEWQGIDGNWLPQSTSILAGIRERAGDGVTIEYALDGVFEDASTLADLGIAVVGEKPYAEGWGDTEYPILDTADREAIKKLQASCKRVVVVLVSGRPLLVTNEISSWDAVVAAWLPGSEGAGVADVLFDDAPFRGRLPLPWPHHSEQMPISATGKTEDGTMPLYTRGFGL